MSDDGSDHSEDNSVAEITLKRKKKNVVSAALTNRSKRIKTGIAGIPILPSNMKATKKRSPKRFYAQITYIFIYLGLWILFAVYAVTNFIEYLDAQNNPVITTAVGGATELTYPVVGLCPFMQGMTLKEQAIDITHCGTEDEVFICKDEKTSGLSSKKLTKCKDNYHPFIFPSLSKTKLSNHTGCVLMNLDEQLTDELTNEILSGDCKKKEFQQPKKHERVQAVAKGIGAQHRYSFTITTDGTVDTLSIILKPSIREFDSRSADDSVYSFPEGSKIAIYLKLISYQCESCGEEELVYYYNATMSLLSLQNYKTKTEVNMYFEELTSTQLEEVITTSTLDYLGNFAGMLGTLLGFALISWVDRLLTYIIIADATGTSVWDK